MYLLYNAPNNAGRSRASRKHRLPYTRDRFLQVHRALRTASKLVLESLTTGQAIKVREALEKLRDGMKGRFSDEDMEDMILSVAYHIYTEIKKGKTVFDELVEKVGRLNLECAEGMTAEERLAPILAQLGIKLLPFDRRVEARAVFKTIFDLGSPVNGA